VSPDVRELHVTPHQHSGGWLVGTGDGLDALSWHSTANEAEDAAKRYATDGGARCIYVHDRYERVRAVPPAAARRRGASGRRRADTPEVLH
jgi:Uncharacterized protein conserved in bacteria (DUF2188)